MSKYKQYGAYHYDAFKGEDPAYRAHVLDVIDKVKEFARPQGRILDVGAGEGLIGSVIRNRLGMEVHGCDPDEYAFKLSQEKGNSVVLGTIDHFAGEKFDATICLDVLEHVEEVLFEATMNSLKASADLLFIAVPSTHDKHGFRDFGSLRAIVELFAPDSELDDEWEVLHSDDRQARYFVVLRKA